MRWRGAVGFHALAYGPHECSPFDSLSTVYLPYFFSAPFPIYIFYSCSPFPSTYFFPYGYFDDLDQ